jgi:outer membrane receptor protein involved in Fe transport
MLFVTLISLVSFTAWAEDTSVAPAGAAISPVSQPAAPEPAQQAAAPSAALPESLENMFLTELPKVTIASAKAEDPDQAPADVFVITGEEMVQRGYRSLVDLVQDLPGVTIDHNVSDQGGTIAVRGIQSNQMFRLMINGMPINPAAGNSIPWDDRFSIAEIERVEFILGPYPALYGRNTFSGIMNVVTKTGAQLKGGEVKALYGSWNKTQGTAVVGAKEYGFDVMVSLFKNVSASGWDMAKDYPEIYGAQARQEQYPVLSFDNLDPSWTTPWDATDVFVRVMHDTGFFLDFSWNRFTCAKEGNYYSPVIYLQNKDAKVNENLLNGDLGYQFTWEALESTTTFGIQRFDWNCNNLYNFTLDNDGNAIDNVRGEKYYAVASTDYSLTERARIKLWDQNDLYAGAVWDVIMLNPYKTSHGGLVSTEAVLPTWNADEVQQLNYLNISLQDEMRFTSYLKAVAGIMYEKSNTYTDVFMPRFSIVAEPLESTTVKLIYSTGYITPDPLDAIDQLIPGSSTKGVPNIRPESIDAFDLNVIQRAGKNLRLTGSLFYNRIKDIIQTVPDNTLPAPFVQTYKNMGQTIAKGFELGGDYGVTPFLKLTAGYGVVFGQADSVDPDGNLITNEYLVGAANHHLKVGINLLLFDVVTFYVHDLLIGERWKATGEMLEGYNLVDLALTTTPHFDKNWFLSARVKNLLNRKGFDVGFSGDFITTDLAIPLRTWDVEVGYRF